MSSLAMSIFGVTVPTNICGDWAAICSVARSMISGLIQTVCTLAMAVIWCPLMKACSHNGATARLKNSSRMSVRNGALLRCCRRVVRHWQAFWQN